jgi:predicted RNase H-like nuclease
MSGAVAGVDGCRAGWVVASWGPDPAELTVAVVRSFAEVGSDLARGRWDLVAVDMPFGLPDRGPRTCDIEARRRLGPRRSSVFPTPVRAVLGARTYTEALAASRAASGVGLSRQAWNLVPKIREVEAVVRQVGSGRLREVHPELAFAALTGAPLAHPKRSPLGQLERRVALASALPTISRDALPRVTGAAHDDVADALALAWSARRLVAGGGEQVGGDTDSTGLPMAISW